MSHTIEQYDFVDLKLINGHVPTVHIPTSAYNRAEWLLDQFICERAPLDLLRGFARTIRVGEHVLAIEIPSMYVYWRKCEAEDGEWYEPTGIYPTWVQADLYDEDGEKLPHDFDLNVVISKLITH